jgi:telomerase Cajal body protein 1
MDSRDNVALDIESPHCILAERNHYIGNVLLSPDQSTVLYQSNSIGLVDVDSKKQLELTGIPYSLAWFPFMSKQDPTLCCFVTAIKNRPVQLYDSNTLRLRYSYKTKDNADEVRAPLTVRFNLDGSKIYCGFKSELQIFGIEGELDRHIFTSPFQKSKDGLKGLISTIDFNPDCSGIYALGSFGGQIGLYDERNNEEFCLFRDPDGRLGTFQGITQTQFSPDGRYLLSCSRNSDNLAVWDIRNTGDILHRLCRPGLTPQRIYFDCDGENVYSGGTDGIVRCFRIATGMLVGSLKVSLASVAGCSVGENVVVTGSGQREFALYDDDSVIGDCKLGLWHWKHPRDTTM